VDSQNGDNIMFIGRNGILLETLMGSKAAYKLQGNEYYIRSKITNNNGKMAWTQPLFVGQKLI
jgi:hypothetical protein